VWYFNKRWFTLPCIYQSYAFHARQYFFFRWQISSNESSQDSNNSIENITKAFTELEIADETVISLDTLSTASTYSDDPPSTNNDPRSKLNDFLVACDIAPIEREWLDWDEASETTRQRYTKRSADIVSAVLNTVSRNNASDLWKALISSTTMNAFLSTDGIPQSEKAYLEALAEAYNNATSWENRRQVLSIMTGIAIYKVICKFIPGLTKYRYTMANLHRLQFGRGAQLQHQPSIRIRVDLKQLDHFLSFVTSPHLVQDLPFGQKKLKLSSGEVIEVPNVIRTMVPQRIARQYSQFCQETSFKPFSERTILRVLKECSATVRKSLQGLDYFAAEGARAFDELVTLVRQIGELGAGQEWEKKTFDALRSAKLYLKGDYKVSICKSYDQ